MVRKNRKNTIGKTILKKLKKNNLIGTVEFHREFYLLGFFVFIFFLLILRLFYLQVIKADYYEKELSNQNISNSYLKADRGHIFALDKAGKKVKLTENITSYNLFVDPKFIGDKQKCIELITPLVYEHLCKIHGLEKVDKKQCIENIQNFVNKDLLPDSPDFFYYGSGIVSDGYYLYDWTGFNNQTNEVVTNFKSGTAFNLIKNYLDEKIYIGINPKNYVGFFSNNLFIEELKSKNWDWVDIKYDNYVYIIPDNVRNKQRSISVFEDILEKYGYLESIKNLDRKFSHQENRYVKIVSNMNPHLAQKIKDLKNEYYQERNKDNIPILHGLGLEKNIERYYPYGSFLSNVLGYVDINENAYYGIEQYYDDLLGGKDGKIVGRSSAWIGQVGANEFEIEDVVNGSDVVLTIDIGMQKEIEMIVKNYHKWMKADSVSVLVYDPFEGKIKASAMYPSYNPNDYNDAYNIIPLGIENKDIVDNETYIDVPVYVYTGGEYKLATTVQRYDTGVKKYISQNVYGSQVFVDRNISSAYEPGSIFKAFTVGVGIDTDEMRFYDIYDDPGFVDVGPYTIKNADDNCKGKHSFLHAFVHSCNVGMVRIAQRVGKESFYNYIKKLGFGNLTNIELAGEDEGFVEGVNSTSLARYLNNTFGQGLLATPLQIAAGYGSLVNGGYYVKPTIVEGFIDNNEVYTKNNKKVLRQIFKDETSYQLREGLYNIMEKNKDYIKNIRIVGFTLGGKSGTSQISFKGKYQNGLGWTNTSFVGFITRDNPRYIVVVQVRRPRTALWGSETAGRVFSSVAEFILKYSFIDK